jgi:hypothetical protein
MSCSIGVSKENVVTPIEEPFFHTVLPKQSEMVQNGRRIKMYAVRNPSRRKGTRNVFCRDYSQCLDDAAKNFWKDWDCSGCEQSLNRESDIELCATSGDSIGVYAVSNDLAKRLGGSVL